MSKELQGFIVWTLKKTLMPSVDLTDAELLDSRLNLFVEVIYMQYRVDSTLHAVC